jgi:lactose/L-arabinose transport system ATP-binding protein
MNFLAADVIETGPDKVTVALTGQPAARLTLPIRTAIANGAKVALGVRPEHFVAASKGDTDLTVDIDVAEHLGSTSYVYAHIGSGERVIVEREESRASSNKDETLTVGISAAASFLFDNAGKRLH